MMYVGIIAGALLAVLVFSTIFYTFRHDKKIAKPVVETHACVLEVADKSDKIKVEAIEREVFKKADKVKQMASQRAKTAIMKAPVRVSVEVSAMPAVPPPAIERTPDMDPLNESSVLKSISNKVEHVKKLSQDF